MTSDGAFCLRGHPVAFEESDRGNAWSRPQLTVPAAPARCRKCGAKVLTACPACGASIPEINPLYGRLDPYPFCECGEPFPWADTQAMIYHLQNLLENEDLNPAQQRELASQLELLQNESLPSKEQRAVWEAIKTAAPAFLTNPLVLKVAAQLVADDGIRRMLNL